jgi:hypothetical protein
MTTALCFNCGHLKYGAICSCPKCKLRSTGDTKLDILFSDHFMAHSTLNQFGTVVKFINEHVDHKDIRFWTFMFYVSERHSDLLKIDPPQALAEQIQDLYSQLEFPSVQVLPGMRNQSKPQTGDPKQDDVNMPGRDQSAKKWWQFWR